MIYANGWLSAKVDETRAREWLSGAATMGHPLAMLELGRRLLERRETAAQAVQWLQRALDQGSVEAAGVLVRHHARSGEVRQVASVVATACRRLSHVSSKFDWRS